ncbi:hypothetical protein EDB19DRAFT_2026767 [Suillus lakei]|nr:hypothetical protein EDB19DRAFT_2026767 [Suillus lakei]
MRFLLLPKEGAQSYCWTNDAERLRVLINTGKTEYEAQLKELVLRNLAEYLDVAMHACDWNDNPLVMGAFAFFRPRDFQDLYTALTISNSNVSFRWVVGGLDSAWYAVYEYLLASGQPKATFKRFFALLGQNVEWHILLQNEIAGGLLEWACSPQQWALSLPPSEADAELSELVDGDKSDELDLGRGLALTKSIACFKQSTGKTESHFKRKAIMTLLARSRHLQHPSRWWARVSSWRRRDLEEQLHPLRGKEVK